MKKLIMALSFTLLLVSTAHAFDVKLIYSSNKGTSWTEASKTYVDEYGVYDTDNIGFEIGHYKNSNKEGFGFGWHLGMSTPVSGDFWEGGTVLELGLAPGYSITEELAVKLELAMQFKNGWSDTEESSNGISQSNIAGFAYGLSAEYVFADHYVIGGAIKNYTYTKMNDTADPILVPELSAAYRF